MAACQCHKANHVDYELLLTHKTCPQAVSLWKSTAALFADQDLS